MMKPLRLVLLGVLLAWMGGSAMAQDAPADRDRPAERDRGSGPPGAPRGPFPMRGFGRYWRLDPDQWADAAKFMKEHSPKRWELFEKVGAETEQKDRLTRAIS